VIELHILASGSRGNAALLVLPGSDRLLMIDAGLSPRRTRQAIEALGKSHFELTDVLLTHGDGDHLHAGWERAAPSWSFTLHVHQGHLSRVHRAGLPSERIRAFDNRIDIDPAVRIRTAMAAHDTHGTTAFAIEHQGARLGWATDLGRFDGDVCDMFQQEALDAFAIESNYDPLLQANSGRPAFLIDRITSGAGHLSNEDAIAAVLSLARCDALQHIVLLHRSEQCNCPDRMRHLWRSRAPHLEGRVTIPSQATRCEPICITPESCPI